MLLGEHFAFLELRLDGYRGVLLMILPPGGFLALGFLVAARQRMLPAPGRAARARTPR